MSIREQLFTSFIKGIGKTSGTVTVFGLLGAAWYLYNKGTNYSLTKRNNEETTTENEEIVLQEVEQETENDLESETIKDELNGEQKKSRSKQSQNFRRIFDGL
jgi:hypothetical protein